MPVKLKPAKSLAREVCPQLHVVVDFRHAPALRGVGHMGVARGHQQRRVRALHGAVAWRRFAILQACVEESAGPKGETRIARESH